MPSENCCQCQMAKTISGGILQKAPNLLNSISAERGGTALLCESLVLVSLPWIFRLFKVISVKLFGALTLRNSEICRNLAWDSELKEK